MSWEVTANEIDKWSSSNTREAQQILPLLIKKLILATVELKQIHIPSGDSILTGGWDGTITVKNGNVFIPDGKSVFEFGTNVNINKKAEDDYIKRTENFADKDVSYIFATTKTWAKKSEFEDEKNREKKWKEVRGINSDDLETWLNLAPAVHRWFARKIGKRVVNSFDIEQAFEQWSSQTKLNLSGNLVIDSREKQIKELWGFLENEPSKIIINSLSERESYAFILASLVDEIKYSNRVLIITTQEAWDSIIEVNYNLILVYKDFIPNNIGVAIKNRYFVIESQESVNIKDKSTNIVELPKIKKTKIAAILEEMGLNHDESWEVYRDTKGFLHAITNHPLLEPQEKDIPKWVADYDIDILSSILFINSWNRIKEDDKKELEELSNLSYEDFEKILYLLKDEKNTPIRLIGNIWQVISKINLWDLIVSKISIKQIDKLKQISINVFGEIDPSFEVVPKDRWSAYDKRLKYSSYLRDSLADTLVLMSVFGKQVNYSYDVNIAISNWLKELFELNLNVESWYSYGSTLPLLAEASPGSFLNAIEKTLDNQLTTKLEELFEEADPTIGSCFHCNLLWALERVSWNIDFLPRVVLILARLSKLEIKSKMSNHPFNTLKEIFFGWINYSSINHKQKIQILENILYKNYPDTTWRLLIKLLPDSHSIASGIKRPKYNDWDEYSTKEVTRQDLHLYEQNINRILLENVGVNTKRWHDILDNINKFYKDNIFKAIDTFVALDKSLFSDDNKLAMSLALREKIHNHRKYKDSPYWDIPTECIDKFETAFNFIEPDSLIDRYFYLFQSGVYFLNHRQYDKEDRDTYKEEDIVVKKERKKAILEILEKDGFDSLVELIKKVDLASHIGRILFLISGDKYQKKMLAWLDSEDYRLLTCAYSYISSMPFDEDILQGLSVKQKVEILSSLKFDSITFEHLKKQNQEVQKTFWENQNYYYGVEDNDVEYISWIFEQLYIHNQHMKAIDFLSHQLNTIKNKNVEISIDFIYKVLIEMNPNEEKLESHSISEIINFLQDSELKDEELRQIEWKYLQLNNFNPINLEKEIIENPNFFVELISYIYKPKNKKNEDEGLTQDQISNRANNSEKLLERVTIFRDYKNPTFKKLKSWIEEAQKGFIESDRVNIGNREIGKMLSKAPNGKDKVFPCEIVRDILERFSEDTIGKAFIHGIMYPNGYRSTTRAYDTGGEQEYSLANGYKRDAETLKFSHPITSSLLKELANNYEHEAKREDLRNDINE